MSEPISAVIFDVGQVLYHWEPRLLYERLIDDERRTNAAALLASLNMLITTPGGFDFTAADCVAWVKDAGFRDARVEPLVSAHAMVVAIK